MKKCNNRKKITGNRLNISIKMTEEMISEFEDRLIEVI